MTSDSKFDDLIQPNPAGVNPAQSGSLIGSLSAGLYVLFTLIPDSHSLMVVWPWVLIWQLTWICPMLWLAWQLWQTPAFPRLGRGLDWIAALAAMGLLISTLFAVFPNQARWYAWPALGGLAAIYSINAWCQTPNHRQCLLVAQGLLSSGFILISLGLWISQTFLPELSRIRTLQQAGVQVSYNFSTLELRNWAPFGHQNYVAGYLVLALPLLFGLCLTQARWRWGWAASLGLGLLDLYTTSSRGGWLGCLVGCLYLGIALSQRRHISRRWLMSGSLVGIGILAALVLANNRLSAQLSSFLQGRLGGDMAYRIITHAAGWRMGLQNPWTGMGAGSVPLAYQAYRPTWAGLEAEHAYQLHGTLPQMWAELGIAGMLPFFLLLGWLVYQSWYTVSKPKVLSLQSGILTQSLLAGLLGYSIVCLTDYQLDNIGISGFLVISIGGLAAMLRSQARDVVLQRQDQPVGRWPRHRWLAGSLLGVILTGGIWLAPIHGAWQLSSQGFAALNQQQLDLFRQRLRAAQAQAPWEPYYAYQLGWNLGELGSKSKDPQLRQTLLQSAAQNFVQGNQASPEQEFGHTNLAWLYMQVSPQKATPEFVQSAQLIPAKRGVFFGLGLSLLGQGQTDLALQAMTLECLRDPLWITSPAWRSQPLQSLYEPLLDSLEQAYGQVILAHPSLDDLNPYLHQMRGSLYWWRGNLEKAQADLDPYGSSLSRTLLMISKTKPGTQINIPPDLTGAARSMIQAWSEPTQREALIRQAWLASTQTSPAPELVQTTVQTMAKAQTFQQWLQEYPIVRKYHRHRAGFGVLSRHADGPNPTDFFLVIDNGIMTEIFAEMMPYSPYMPALDRVLQERREALLVEVKALSENAMLASSLIQSGVID